MRCGLLQRYSGVGDDELYDNTSAGVARKARHRPLPELADSESGWPAVEEKGFAWRFGFNFHSKSSGSRRTSRAGMSGFLNSMTTSLATTGLTCATRLGRQA